MGGLSAPSASSLALLRVSPTAWWRRRTVLFLSRPRWGRWPEGSEGASFLPSLRRRKYPLRRRWRSSASPRPSAEGTRDIGTPIGVSTQYTAPSTDCSEPSVDRDIRLCGARGTSGHVAVRLCAHTVLCSTVPVLRLRGRCSRRNSGGRNRTVCEGAHRRDGPRVCPVRPRCRQLRGWDTDAARPIACLLYTSPSPRDRTRS